jgi:hypothetical protein
MALPMLLALLFLLDKPAIAAWTQPKGEGLAILTFGHYVAEEAFDRAGERHKMARFAKQELRAYMVYGLTDRLTLGIEPTLRRVRTAYAPPQSGWAEGDLFARYLLWQGGEAVLSAQALVKIPSSDERLTEPGRETRDIDTEGRVLFGSNLTLFGLPGFGVAEAAFRRRFGAAADEMRADLTLGLRPWPRWTLLAQSFNIVSMRNAQTPEAPDFDQYKAQGSVVYDLTTRIGLQAGAFTEYAGRNVGAGHSVFLALWLRF